MLLHAERRYRDLYGARVQEHGKFAGATGSGTYAITLLAEANLLPGKTSCSANNTGNVIAKGASITFKATGPLTLKS